MLPFPHSGPMIETMDGLHGAYTHRFARNAWGDQKLRDAIDAGEVVGLSRGVLLDAGRVLDLRTRCAAAQLMTGGVGAIVGPTAAALHGCTAVGGFPIHVRVPYAYRIRSRGGVIVHQGELPPEDVTMLDGLRVLPLDLAVAEVLCACPQRAALACADQAMHHMRAEDRQEFLANVTDRLAARADRRGTRQAATVLSFATGRPETALQSSLVLVFAECGFPPPVPQYELAEAFGRVRYRLDFGWPEYKVAVECTDESPPGATDEELAKRGWLVIRADEEDAANPMKLCRRLRKALNRRKVAA